MDCTTTQSILIDFHAGDLDEDVASEVSRHLAGCCRCARAHGAFQAFARRGARPRRKGAGRKGTRTRRTR